MPGSGDSIQALKAGVMEIPDIIVINKADHPMTDTMVREVRGVLALSHEEGAWKVPVLRTEAMDGVGVDELARKIDEHRAFIEAQGTLAERRARNLRSEVIGIATARMRRQLEAWAAEDAGTAELMERVVRRELDPATAARELLERHTDG
jgi:LAO/AO transport system kinase